MPSFISPEHLGATWAHLWDTKMERVRQLPKLIAASLLAAASTTPALAADVRLQSLDGGTTLSGELLGYDGRTYQLRTIVGDLNVDALRVRCLGDDCPVLEERLDEMTVSGAPELLQDLMPALLSAYAADLGGTVLAQDDGKLLLQDQNEEDLLKVAFVPKDFIDAAALQRQDTQDILMTPRAVDGVGGAADERVIALDGFVPVVSPSNSLRAIAASDLARIFAGEVTNWAQLGGNDAPINVYIGNPESASYRMFEDLVMRPASAELSVTAMRTSTDENLERILQVDPLGIGIMGMSNVGDAKVLGVRGACGIQVPATDFNIKTEEYPLTHRIHMYFDQDGAPAHVARFADFLAEPAAQRAIASAGYTNLVPGFQSNNEQGLRYLSSILPNGAEMTFDDLQNLGATLMQSERSSISVRFALGSSDPDARAVADISQFANLIAAADLRNKEIVVVGFTDSIGTAENNRALSERRAAQVREALIAALPAEIANGINIVATGFGEVSPLNCNDTDNGRRVNRRVEIWLRDVVVPSQ